MYKTKADVSDSAAGISLSNEGPPEFLVTGAVVELGSSLLELASVTTTLDDEPGRTLAQASQPQPRPSANAADIGYATSVPPLESVIADVAITAAPPRVSLNDKTTAPAFCVPAVDAPRQTPPSSAFVSPLLAEIIEVGVGKAGAARLQLLQRCEPVLGAPLVQASSALAAATMHDLELLASVLHHALAAVKRALQQTAPAVICISDSEGSQNREPGGDSAPSKTSSVVGWSKGSWRPCFGGVPVETGVSKRDRKALGATKPPRMSKARQLAVDALAVAAAGSVTTELAKKRRKKTGGGSAAVTEAPDTIEQRTRYEDLFPPQSTTAIMRDGTIDAASVFEDASLPPSRVGRAAHPGVVAGPTLWSLAGAGGSCIAPASVMHAPPVVEASEVLPSQTFLPPPFTQSAYDTELLGGSRRASNHANKMQNPALQAQNPAHSSEHRSAASPSCSRHSSTKGDELAGGGNGSSCDSDSDAPLPDAVMDHMRSLSPSSLARVQSVYPDLEASLRFVCSLSPARLRAGREAMVKELVEQPDTEEATRRALRFFIEVADIQLRTGVGVFETCRRGFAEPELDNDVNICRRPTPELDDSATSAPVESDAWRLTDSRTDTRVAAAGPVVENADMTSSPARVRQTLENVESPQHAASEDEEAALVALMATPDLARALADFGVRPGDRSSMKQNLLEALRGDRALTCAALSERLPASENIMTAGLTTKALADLSPTQQVSLLIRSRRDLHESVLLYETQSLHALYEAAKSAGITLSAQALKKALINLGVSVSESRCPVE